MAGLLTLVAVYSIFLGPVFEMYVAYSVNMSSSSSSTLVVVVVVYLRMH